MSCSKSSSLQSEEIIFPESLNTHELVVVIIDHRFLTDIILFKSNLPWEEMQTMAILASLCATESENSIIFINVSFRVRF